MSTSGNRPAFPVSVTAIEQGVCVRDWIAAMALPGIMSKGLDVIGDRVVSISERNLIMARHAYAIADAMLIASAEPSIQVHAPVGASDEDMFDD